MISSHTPREEVRDELRISRVAAELFFTVDNHSEADHSTDGLNFGNLGKNPFLARLEPLGSFHWTA